MSEPLWHRSARDVVGLLGTGELSPTDALDAIEQRVLAVDGTVNALPITCFDRARRRAELLEAKHPRDRGPLAGLPLPIKDLTAVEGVRTTMGSKLEEHNVSDYSDVLVEHLEARGGVVYAKSNTPEFGAGGNTFNDVFGPTRNPHDVRLTAGGSSGGAAAALASGTAWLAHGSDLAGSLRTPASFCGVTSLRPSPGLIASGPSSVPFLVHPQQGPMARDVADLALFADAMAGEHHTVGLSKPAPARSFQEAADTATRPTRVAFSIDLGLANTSPVVADICRAAASSLERDGTEVVEQHPDLRDAAEAFDAHRALMYAALLGDDLEATRDILKPELVWNTELGLHLSGADIRGAIAAQGRVFRAAADFMRTVDLLICPASIVPPFPVEERYVGYGDGLPPEHYYRWLSIVSAITATTLPVVTVPCGRTDGGLPIGMQLIGRPHGDVGLMSHAAHVEQLLDHDPAPIDPQPLETSP